MLVIIEIFAIDKKNNRISKSPQTQKKTGATGKKIV